MRSGFAQETPSIESLIGLGWFSYCSLTTFGDSIDALQQPQCSSNVSISRGQPLFSLPPIWSKAGPGNSTQSFVLPNAVQVTGSNPSASSSPTVSRHAFPTTTAYYDWRQQQIAQRSNQWLPQRPLPREVHFADFNNGTAILIECSVAVTLLRLRETALPSLVAGSPLASAIGALPPAFGPSTQAAFDAFQRSFGSGYLASASFGGLLGLDAKVAASAVGPEGLSLSGLEAEAARVVDNVMAERGKLDGVSMAFQQALLALGTGQDGINLFNTVRGGSDGTKPLPTGTNATAWRALVAEAPVVTEWGCAPWEGILTDSALQGQRVGLSQYLSRQLQIANAVVQEQLEALPDGQVWDERYIHDTSQWSLALRKHLQDFLEKYAGAPARLSLMSFRCRALCGIPQIIVYLLLETELAE